MCDWLGRFKITLKISEDMIDMLFTSNFHENLFSVSNMYGKIRTLITLSMFQEI